MTEIKYKDLNGWLRLFVVLGWIVIGTYTISFLIGFIGGLLGYY